MHLTRNVKENISVRSESSLCVQWIVKDHKFLHEDSEDSDQTGWMPRLIGLRSVHVILFVLSCCGSYVCRRTPERLPLSDSKTVRGFKPQSHELCLQMYSLKMTSKSSEIRRIYFVAHGRGIHFFVGDTMLGLSSIVYESKLINRSTTTKFVSTSFQYCMINAESTSTSPLCFLSHQFKYRLLINWNFVFKIKHID